MAQILRIWCGGNRSVAQIELDIDLSKLSDQSIQDKIKDAIETLKDRRKFRNSDIPGFEDLVWGKQEEEHEAKRD